VGGSAWESHGSRRLLKKKYATRVVLFGSLAPLAPSDIDLYSEGIPGDLFFEADAEIEEIAKGFKVDLVDKRECPAQLLREIEAEGIVL
jgi:predicted nucleotidyltransferase